MVISIKSSAEIEKMFASGKLCATIMEEIAAKIKAGISTKSLDDFTHKLVVKAGAIASFKNYRGFPASICTSLNAEVVHGIPSAEKILKEGDIISIDLGVILKGYHSDMARTFAVGEISSEAKRLIDVTRQSFFEGIKLAKEGNRLKEMSCAIEDYVLENNCNVVKALVGHGIGKELHEAPDIPNYNFKGPNPRLRAGMTLAIEPMVNLGTGEVDFAKDSWHVYTRDRKLSAHYENTILITNDEPQIMTKL